MITTPPAMNLTIQHSIISAFTSTVDIAMASVQAKHKENMLALCKIIKKALFFRESGSFTSLSNSNASNKLALLADLPTKSTKR